MKIIQISNSLIKGDGVSNQILAMDKAFRQLGYNTEIFVRNINPSTLTPAKNFEELICEKDDLIIYHMSSGTSFVNRIMKLPERISIYYHNITPAKFLLKYSLGSFIHCLIGRHQLKELKNKTKFAWAASKYSRQELIELGYANTSTLPIMINFAGYKAEKENEEIISRYSDGKLNMLFVGRVTPHKKQEDAVKVLSYYKNRIDTNVRLILVGSQKRRYVSSLKRLIHKLGLDNDVVFTNKVSFNELCSYYRVSDLFLCLSEHEGFCIPLIESMIFNKPVFAYAAAAVPETIAEAGILFKDKDYKEIAETIKTTMFSEGKLAGLSVKMANRLSELEDSILLAKLKTDLEIIKNLT